MSGAGAAPPVIARGAADKVSVDAARLDRAMDQIGELVLLRNRLAAAIGRLGPGNDVLVRLARETDLAVTDMQSTVMGLRLQSCQRLFSDLPAALREACASCGRDARIELEGLEVELDKSMLDVLRAPLDRLVRHVVAHCIEDAAERVAAGKRAQGTIRVAAVHLGDKFQVSVSDDGRNLDARSIVATALARRLARESDLARLGDQEILQLVLLPGFWAGDGDDVAAGIGAVQETIQGLRGRMSVERLAAGGTRWLLELPLSLAVLPVLYFQLRREYYAIPVALVENLVEVHPGMVHNVSGAAVIDAGDRGAVPYIDLGLYLHGVPLRPERDPCEGILTSQGLLVVSEAIAIEDAVVKPVDIAQQGSWYQGATISGDGGVVLILDLDAFVKAIRARDAA